MHLQLQVHGTFLKAPDKHQRMKSKMKKKLKFVFIGLTNNQFDTVAIRNTLIS